MTALLNAEQSRRAEHLREHKAAAGNDETLEQRSSNREDSADRWAAWFKEKMDRHACSAEELLPDAFARVQQIAEDRANQAVRELRTALTKAIKP